MKLCDETEPIIRENVEYFNLGGEGEFNKLDISRKFDGMIKRCAWKLNGPVVEGVAEYFTTRSRPRRISRCWHLC